MRTGDFCISRTHRNVFMRVDDDVFSMRSGNRYPYRPDMHDDRHVAIQYAYLLILLSNTSGYKTGPFERGSIVKWHDGIRTRHNLALSLQGDELLTYDLHNRRKRWINVRPLRGTADMVCPKDFVHHYIRAYF